MNLFVASMLILVLGSNLLVTFVGWEGVGTCSYWLVSFWFTRESAASAGKKAFLYNRIGDVGFLLAIFLVFEQDRHARVHQASSPTCDRIGAGQRHRHLPAAAGRRDGEVGPDPAVPVAGRRHGGPHPGVGPDPRRHHGHRRRLPAVPDQPAAARLVGRRSWSWPSVGAATAFVAATIACAQQDIKKVLAYSTVSQLGYMFLAVGCGRLRGGHLPHGGPRLLQGRCSSSGPARSSTASTTSRT